MSEIVEKVNELTEKIKLLSMINVTEKMIPDYLVELGEILEKYQENSDFIKALQEYNKPSIEILFANLGRAWRAIPDFEKAVYAYRKSEEICAKKGEEALLLMIGNNIAQIYDAQGKKEEAIQLTIHILNSRIFARPEMLEQRVLLTNNLAAIYSDIGNSQKSLELYDQCLALLKDASLPELERNIRRNRANVAGRSSGFDVLYDWPIPGIFKEMYLIYSTTRDFKRSVPVHLSDKKGFLRLVIMNLNVKEIYYYFKGVDEEGKVIIDDNGGQYYTTMKDEKGGQSGNEDDEIDQERDVPSHQYYDPKNNKFL